LIKVSVTWGVTRRFTVAQQGGFYRGSRLRAGEVGGCNDRPSMALRPSIEALLIEELKGRLSRGKWGKWGQHL
jgi:hypothetical protein